MDLMEAEDIKRSGKNTGVGCHFLLLLFSGIFLTQASNPGLLHCRQSLYQLSYEGSPTKFAGISSAALSQHHLLGFEIAQLEFHHFH